MTAMTIKTILWLVVGYGALLQRVDAAKSRSTSESPPPHQSNLGDGDIQVSVCFFPLCFLSARSANNPINCYL